jgi:hypothetical protein
MCPDYKDQGAAVKQGSLIIRISGVFFCAAHTAAFAQGLAGFHLVHQFAQHAAGRMGEYEGHQAMKHCNNGNDHKRACHPEGKSQMLEIGFIGIVQMLAQECLFFHSGIITDFAMRDKSQICDAGQHRIAGQFCSLIV